MPPATDNTTAEPDMLALAAQADAQLDTSSAPAPAEAAAPATAPQENTGVPPAEGKDAKPEAQAPDAAKKEEPAKADDKPAKKESNYEKAKGDAERKDRSWKALEEEKAQVRAEKARYEAELATARRELAQLRTAKPAGPAKDEHGNTSEDYRALAARYAAEGNDDMAALAKAKAEKLSQSAAPAATQGTPAAETPEFKAQWQNHTQQLIAQDPELANPENPVVKAANAILADANYGRFFKSHPDGIKAAVEVARLMQANQAQQETTKKLKETEATLTKAQAEVQRLNGLLQPRGSHPAGQPGSDRKIEDMNADEAAAEIQRIARAADRGDIP